MKNIQILARRLTLAAGAVAVAALSLVGCSGATATEPPQTSASALTKAPIGANAHGAVKLVGEALGDVALRPDQRAELEKLALGAEARHAAMVDGRRELMTALADQVEKGALDTGALQPRIDRVVADVQGARPDDQAALLRVHALLDGEQRSAFVDALQARMKGEHGGRGGGGHHAGFAKMKQLADDLKLSDEQRAQIKEVMKAEHARGGGPAFREMGDRFRAGKHALETFRSDKFEPRSLAGKRIDLRDGAHEGTTRMLGAVEKILPILTPEQRKLAADKLRDFSAHGGPAPFWRSFGRD